MGLRIVVGGGVARHPIGSGGYAWIALQYLLGLRRLGHAVLYVEELDAADCIDDEWRRVPFDRSANAAMFAALLDRHGLRGAGALLHGAEHVGLPAAEVDRWADGADLLINLSGRLHRRALLRGVRRRVYVDLDPGFTQIWQAGYGVDMNLAGHDAFVTVGLNLGRAGCPIPTLGLPWRPLLPPLVIEEWAAPAVPGSAYTTVADWRGYAPVEWAGRTYGQKAEEILRILDLPGRVAVPLELCLAIHPDEPDLPRLRAHGWRLSDPRLRAADSEAYRRYVVASRGELSVAKHGYVAGHSGWVSDRTACYLAAGRPAIVQDTGLDAHLPIGEGLLTFTGAAGAATALEAVERDWVRHSRAAVALARRCFDSDRVLSELLDAAAP